MRFSCPNIRKTRALSTISGGLSCPTTSTSLSRHVWISYTFYVTGKTACVGSLDMSVHFRWQQACMS